MLNDVIAFSAIQKSALSYIRDDMSSDWYTETRDDSSGPPFSTHDDHGLIRCSGSQWVIIGGEWMGNRKTQLGTDQRVDEIRIHESSSVPVVHSFSNFYLSLSYDVCGRLQSQLSQPENVESLVRWLACSLLGLFVLSEQPTDRASQPASQLARQPSG